MGKQLRVDQNMRRWKLQEKRKGFWDCGRNVSWVQPWPCTTRGAIMALIASYCCSNWLTCWSLWFILEERCLDGEVISIFMQTCIFFSWGAHHSPVGPRAWHSWDLAAPGAWPESLLWTDIWEDQNRGDSAVSSFIVSQSDGDQEGGCLLLSSQNPEQTAHLALRALVWGWGDQIQRTPKSKWKFSLSVAGPGGVPTKTRLDVWWSSNLDGFQRTEMSRERG